MLARPVSFPPSQWGTTRGKLRHGLTLIELLVTLSVLALLVALLFPATRMGGAREAARRSQCKNNLKQIGLALHNYAETYGAFPPAYTVDESGKPLHSWRTLILPFIDEAAMYAKIDLSKPWDDPANTEVFQKRPRTYSCPSADGKDFKTNYLAIVGPQGALSTDHPRPVSEITDGLSETLMVIEVPDANAVPWMAPQDTDVEFLLSLNKETKRQHTGGTHGLLGDGSVRFFSENLPPATWQALCTVAGNDKAGEF